ncbi:hypothetical protein I3842_03G008000 [Carya illinoinensis]|uniref:Exostosin GT47 domain-containing protein n=1 Tax=Carya illinoinensis TaxID=32201 RepID=A0A922JX27_CARIL|nr:hypothetical protein I3842_03G008000 [Carya illinoinensis]
MQFSDKRTFCSFYRQQSSLIFFILFVVVALVVMISVIQRTLGDERSSEFFKTPDSPYSSSSTLPQTGERQERIEKKKESDKINVTTGKSRVKRQYSTLEKIEASLGIARSAIKEAGRTHNLTSTHDDPGYVPRGPIYGNANAFTGEKKKCRSYLEMERIFKINVHEEGEQPLFHYGPCKSIYSTEGSFIHAMEMENIYRTKDPNKAHVYFMPFSVVEMVKYLFELNSHDMDPIGATVADYVNVISKTRPYWNPSLGADHVMLSCHDLGPYASSYAPYLYNMSIRILCNANTSKGFVPSRDVSYPEIHLLTGEVRGLLNGPSTSHRPILAFFAGGQHGHIRPILLKHWEERDEDVLVYECLPNRLNYNSMLKKSKYCLFPRGSEVASPRVVIFENQYKRLQRRVKQVQRHFVVNGPPKRFDIFHKTVHSIRLRTLNIRLKGLGLPLTII